jgi:hypothetical protein
MNIYRVSIKSKDYRKERKSLYVISSSKDSAKIYVLEYLKDGYEITLIQELGEQLGTYMYSGKSKKK